MFKFLSKILRGIAVGLGIIQPTPTLIVKSDSRSLFTVQSPELTSGTEKSYTKEAAFYHVGSIQVAVNEKFNYALVLEENQTIIINADTGFTY